MATNEAQIVISAQDKFSAVFGQATAGLGKMQASAQAFGAALSGIAAGGFVGSLTAMVGSTIKLADELNKLSQRTGITVESLSAIRNAAELADVSTEEFTTGIKKLNVALVSAQDATSKQAALFRALGVDSTKGADAALRGIADAFTKLPDGATKAAVAIEIFGRAGEKLIPLLNGGAAGLDQGEAAAERFGTVISAQLARDAEQLNDNLTKLRQSAGALGIALANQLVPGLVTISDNLVLARSKGDLLNQSLRETRKLYLAAVGGVENLFTGGGGPLDRQAAREFAAITRKDGPVNGQDQNFREQTGPQLPAGKAPDPAALLRALNGGGGGSKPSGPTLADLMASQAAARQALQDASELSFNEDADKAQKQLLDFYAQLALAQQQRIDLAELEADTARRGLEDEANKIKDRLDPTREYIRALERVAELEAAGLLSTRESIAETTRRSDELAKVGDRSKDANDFARSLGLTFTSAFEDAISGGKGFSDILKGIERDLLRLGTRELVTRPALEAFKGVFGIDDKGGSKAVTDIIGSILGAVGFGGAKAAGGPVMAGMGYLVGEKGPELFLPRQSGTIVPNGAGGGAVNVTIMAQDVNSFRASRGQIAAEMSDAIARARGRYR